MSLSRLLSIFLAFFLLAQAFSVFIYEVQAAVPKIIHYQGRLYNASGSLLGGTGTNYFFKFSIYDTSTPGTGVRLWPASLPTETTVSVQNGVFNYDLGSGADGDLSTIDFQGKGDTLYLQVEVAASSGATPEVLSPRQRVVSASNAINAEQLQGATPGTGANKILKLNATGGLDLSDANPNITATALNSNLTLAANGTGKIQFFNSSYTISSTGALVIGSITGTGALTIASGGTNTALVLNGNGTGKVQIAAGSSGDIEFFNTSNKISSSGNLTIVGGITAATSGTINSVSINAGAVSGVSTLNLTGAITGATSTNTINGLIINSGALSGITTQTSSASIATTGGNVGSFTQTGATAATGARSAISLSTSGTTAGQDFLLYSTPFKVDHAGQVTIGTGSGVSPFVISTAYAAGATVNNLSADFLDGLSSASFNQGITAGNGISVTGSLPSQTVAVALSASGSIGVTSTPSGLEFQTGLTLLRGCADAQVLKWQDTAGTWDCAADIQSGSGSVALSGILAATAGNSISNGDHAQVWNWSVTTASKSAFTFGESVASTGSNAILLNLQTLSASTASPFQVTAQGTANGVKVDTTGLLQAIGTGGIRATDLVCTTCVALGSEISGTLPVGNGGTGVTSLTTNGVLYGGATVGVTAAGTTSQYLRSTTSSAPAFATIASSEISNTSFVDLSSAQTVGGVKTFSSALVAPTSTDTINGLVINASALSSVASVTGSGALTVASGGLGALTLRSADQTAGSTNSANVAIKSGDATGVTSNSGNVSIDVGTATGTTGGVSVAGSNASALNLGRSGITTTIAGSVTLSAFGTAGVVHNSATGQLTSSLIVNADVSGAAAIAYSKLNLATSIVGGDLATNISISTTGNIATTGTGAITSAGLLTASNGFTLTTGTLTLPSNSVADSALSTNVALLNAVQTFTAAKTFATATATDDTLLLSPFVGGAARFAGSITSVDLTAARVYTLPNETGTICTTGSICAGYQASGNYIVQVPGSTAINTISPTAASVVGLTVKGTTGTAANVLEIFDSTATPVRQSYFDNTGALNTTKQLISTLATGTAPLSVASTTVVTNLNAALLNGATFASPGAIGSTTAGTGAFTTISATSQITSTLATGTAPFVVSSTTNVANLNASSLNGATFANPGTIGGTTPGAATFTTLTAQTSITSGTTTVAGLLQTPIDNTVGTEKAFILNHTGVALAQAADRLFEVQEGGVAKFSVDKDGLVTTASINNASVATTAGIVYSKLNLATSIVGGDLATNISISTTGNLATTSTGTITSAALLTASNGFTLTTGTLTLPAASVADSALSTNVALLNTIQSFTAAKTFATATATDDTLTLSPFVGGAARFAGSITSADLTAARTYTLPDAGGTFAVAGSNAIALSTAGAISLTLSGATADAGTTSNSGLVVTSTGVSLLRGCGAGQILKWTSPSWACANDDTGAGGTFVNFDPAAAQTSSANSNAIFINRTALGSLLNLTQNTTLAAAYTGEDNLLKRNLVGGANAQGGALVVLRDTSTGTGTINPTALLIDFATPTGATLFTGNFVDFKKADTAGGATVSKFSVSSAGNIIAAGTISASTTSTINGVSINASAISGVTTLGLSGAISGATATNTINNLVINAGALSGITTINASGQITSTLATGTAPFSVASTTNVANLNASSLNGATFASPGAIGSTTSSTGAFTTISASGLISANAGLTLAANQNLTLSTGTGTITQGFSSGVSGTGDTRTVTNTNTTVTATTVNGLGINLVGTTNANANANTIVGVTFGNVTPIANNAFNGLTFGTGYNNFLTSGTINISAAGAVTGATGITSSGSITFSGLSTVGVVHNSAAGLLSTSLVTGSDLASNIAISTTGNIATTGTGTITSAGLLTGSNGLTISAGTVTLPSNSIADGALSTNVALLNTIQSFTAAKTFATATATDDTLILSPFAGGAARFNGSITSADLTAARTYTLPDAGGTLAVAGSSAIGLSTSGAISLTLSGATADAATTTNSGLVVTSTGLSLLRGCGASQILKWTSPSWACADDATGAGGTPVNLDPAVAQTSTTNNSIDINKTNAAGSYLNLNRTLTAAGAYSLNEAVLTRTVADGGFASTGSILKLIDSGTGTGAVSPDLLLINQANTSSGGVTGNLINAQLAGASKFSVSTAGLVTQNGNLTFSGSAPNISVSTAATALTLNAGTTGTITLGSTSTGNVGFFNVANNFITSAGALTVAGAITAPTATNTINSLIINAGAISGGTGITSSGSITFSGLSTAGVVHNSAAGLLSTSAIVNADLSAGSFANITGVGTLGSLIVTGTIATNATSLGAFNVTENLSATGSVHGLTVAPTLGGTAAANTYTLNAFNVANVAGTCPSTATCVQNGLNLGTGLTNYLLGANYTLTSGGAVTQGGNLVFSGVTPTISASTTNTSLSISANGTGTITLASASTGNVVIKNTMLRSSEDPDVNGIYFWEISASGTGLFDSLTSEPGNNLEITAGGSADVVMQGDNDPNFQGAFTLTSDATSINSLDFITTLNGAAGAATIYGANFAQGDNTTNTAIVDAVLRVQNANAAETTLSGLLIEQTGAGTLTNALNILETAGTITNGLRFGINLTNDILFATDSTHILQVEAQDTAATAGSALQILGATGNTSGAGGALIFTAGQGGATGTGGALTITSGAGGGTSGGSGALTLRSGNMTSGASPGDIIIDVGACLSSCTPGTANILIGATVVNGLPSQIITIGNPNAGDIIIDGADFNVDASGNITASGIATINGVGTSSIAGLTTFGSATLVSSTNLLQGTVDTTSTGNFLRFVNEATEKFTVSVSGIVTQADASTSNSLNMQKTGDGLSANFNRAVSGGASSIFATQVSIRDNSDTTGTRAFTNLEIVDFTSGLGSLFTGKFVDFQRCDATSCATAVSKYSVNYQGAVTQAGNLVFSGAAPTISASTTNTTLAISANGSGTVTLGASSTGDIQFYSASNKITNAGALTIAAGATLGAAPTLTNASGTLTISSAGALAISSGGTNTDVTVNAIGTGNIIVGGTVLGGVIRIGDATNNITFAATTRQARFAGTARNTVRINLVPEFPGAVMTGDGTANVGTMTSDATTATPFHNYYKWTSTGTNDYDIWVKVPTPTDFDGVPTGQTICAQVFTSVTTANSITLDVRDTGDTLLTLTDADLTASVASTWQEQCTSSISAGTFVANDWITLTFKLTSPASGDIRLGEVYFDYLSKF